MEIDIAEADWDGFETVMGPRGGSGGCWCMLWRRSRAGMERDKGEANRAAMRAIFAAGPPPGLIARIDGAPVGWIQVDRRDAFPRLASARVLKPVDDAPVWSVSCFLVRKQARGQGVARALLSGACDLAAARGASVIEGYPVDPGRPDYPAAFAWTGYLATFLACGFAEVARRSPTRPIMRRSLSPA